MPEAVRKYCGISATVIIALERTTGKRVKAVVPDTFILEAVTAVIFLKQLRRYNNLETVNCKVQGRRGIPEGAAPKAAAPIAVKVRAR